MLTPSQAAFVAAQRVARLGTGSDDGGPHVVAICPALDGDRVVLATDRAARKTANIASDPRVAVAFDEYAEDWDELRQVVVFGRARIIESGPAFERGRRLLYDKFEQYEGRAPIEEGESVVVEIRVDRVSAAGVS